MNRTIHAKPWEVKALLAGATMLWRPVKPPPRENAELVCLDGLKRHKWTDSFYFIKACPYGQPGDILTIKETWHWDEVGIDVSYKADFTPELIAEAFAGEHWRSPATMPRWAVRPGFIRPITGVQVKRVQSMTPRDVTAAGIPRYMMRFDGVAWDPMQAIQDRWDSRYANTPYAWSANPPAWGITVGGNDDR